MVKRGTVTKFKLCGEVLASTGGFEMDEFDEIQMEIVEAFANIDVDAINAIVAPHGRKVFDSKEELIAVSIQRAIQKMKEDFSRQKAFEEEE